MSTRPDDTGLVERLRERSAKGIATTPANLLLEAADEIERLREVVEDVEGYEVVFEERIASDGIHSYRECIYCGAESHESWCLQVKARAALAAPKEPQ